MLATQSVLEAPLRAEQIGWILPRADGFSELVGARVDHAERVACGVGDDKPLLIR